MQAVLKAQINKTDRNKRHKNDATDAEAICEAVTRPNMRFVATKAPAQQSCLTLHRTRHLFIRQQTSVITSLAGGRTIPLGDLRITNLLPRKMTVE
jgi:transposase